MVNTTSLRTRIACPNCGERYALRDFACVRCGRVRDEKSHAEIFGAGYGMKPYLPLLWPVLGLAGLIIFGSWLVRSRHAPQNHASSFIASAYTAEDRAALLKQKSDDAKFWAAKARRDSREAESYAGTWSDWGGVAAVSPSKSGGDGAQGLIDLSDDAPSAVWGLDVPIQRAQTPTPSSSGTPTSAPHGSQGHTL